MKAGGKASAPAVPLAQPSLIHYETQNSLVTTVRFSLHSWVDHYEKHIKLKETTVIVTSIDVLPSKNQAMCKYCTHVSNY